MLLCDLLARATQAQAVVRTINIALIGKDTRNRTETYRIKTCCANYYAISPYGRFKVNREPHIRYFALPRLHQLYFPELYFLVLFVPFIASLGLPVICSASPVVPRAGVEPATCSLCFMVRTAVLPLNYRSILQASPTDAPFNSLGRYPHGIPNLCIGLTCYGLLRTFMSIATTLNRLRSVGTLPQHTVHLPYRTTLD